MSFCLLGTWMDGDVKREYSGKIDISNPLRSKFKSTLEGETWKSSKSVIFEENGCTKYGSVIWSGIEGLPTKTLKKLVKDNFLSRFQIDISRGTNCTLEVKIHLNPPHPMTRPERAPSATDIKKDISTPNIFCIQTVSELIYLLRTENRRDFLFDELLSRLAKRWKEEFIDFHNWQNTVEIFDCLKLETQKEILLELLKNSKSQNSLAEQSFERLAAFVHRFCTMSFVTKTKLLTASEIKEVVNQALGYLNNTLNTSIPPLLIINCIVDCLTIANNYDILGDIETEAPHIYKQIQDFNKKNPYQLLDFKIKFSLEILMQMTQAFFKQSRKLKEFSHDLNEKIKIQSLDFSWETFLQSFSEKYFNLEENKLVISLFTVLKFHVLKKDIQGIVKLLKDMCGTINEDNFSKQTHSYSASKDFIYGWIDLCTLILDTYPEKEEIVTAAMTLLETLFEKKAKLFSEVGQNIQQLFKKKLYLQRYNKQQPPEEKIIKRTEKLKRLLELVPLITRLRALKHNLEKDSQLERDRKYIIDLYVTQSPTQKSVTRKKISDVLPECLIQKLQRIILLLGENGSGKTLSLKAYVLKLYTKYRPGDPLPFFVPLISLSDPQKSLLQETLDKFELSSFVEFLKKLRTVFYFDGLDEMFIEQSREKTNYFKGPIEEWKEAQFVVSCRTAFLKSGEEERLIAPRELITPLFISSFTNEDIDNFLKGFVTEEWTVERYRKIITQSKLDKMSTNPFNLRIMAETFPEIEKDKKPEDITLFLLFDHWVAYKISDEYTRHRQETNGVSTEREATEFLDFALEISRRMVICQKQSIAKNDLQALKNNAEKTKTANEARLSKLEAGLEKEKDPILRVQLEAEIELCKKRINQALDAPKELLDMLYESKSYEALRRTCFFGKNPKEEFQFIHPRMFEYIRSLDARKDKIDKLKGLIDFFIKQRLAK